ncbi:phosphotransferase [Archangium violaceum]|uniref:Aminoglycoside phosphotransferase n=1 Tax=Archangium violaceum Cb vi76 TaxID=1406225 RepID=A0A084SFW9_9BACT|nr:phosphotransferase [Archangium violaceum]KFA87354.1 aminoglycoside phosphotransferase [Archangium violaceum Cb vi76]
MTIQHLTPSDIEARKARAVAAATSAGRALGLEVTTPKVLHDVFSVVVHLAPSPVVVRVPVVLPPGRDVASVVARQARELAVVTWLADRGLPIVRPSPLVPREPVQRDGLSMTFWELVEVDASRQPDFIAEAALAADLHAALRDYPGELPFLAPMTAVPTFLARLEENPGLLAPADLERARSEWAVLEPVLSSREGFSKAFPNVGIQPIHGDAPSYNILRTASGVRYADFEEVTLGPAEWDLAFLGLEGAAVYNAAAERAGVRPLDPAVLRVMETAGMLQMAACHALVPQLPMLAEGLAPALQRWRTMPFAGGLS